MSWIDAAIGALSPSWAAKRAAARLALAQNELAAEKVRGFNAVSKGRRHDGWSTVNEASQTESAADLATLRLRAREMARNNPYWKSARRAIVGQVVGHGIRAAVASPNERVKSRVQKAWDAWAGSKLVDVTGKLDLYGIQELVMSTVVSDGECLVVRRVDAGGRLRLQVLGAEYLATTRDTLTTSSGGEIVGGIESDEFGAPVAYYVYNRHPSRGMHEVTRLEARDVAHVFLVERPNQQRGESWIAPVFTRLADWDDYEDADLMRQKVSACFGAVYTNVTPEANPGGDTYETHDKIEPGMIEYLPAGSDVKLIAPPASQGLRDAALITHRAIAAGLGITYEALTGDFQNATFSSARMGHLQMLANVRAWQERVMIDLLCDRVWSWFVEVETLRPVGEGESVSPSSLSVEWTVPSRILIDPEKETVADVKRVRAGFASFSQIVREQGRDPAQVIAELAADVRMFDEYGLVLDVDARKVSAQGQGSVNQKQEGTNDGGTGKAA